MVQSGNGESSLESEDASSSFFHVKCTHGCGSLRGSFRADGLESEQRKEISGMK